MSKYLAAYAAIVVVMLAVDLLWIGVVAKPLYQQGIGHLMAPEPRLGVAIAFYLLYAVGILLFAVAPGEVTRSWSATLWWGALFGFFAYATYDLTNLATLRGWPVWLALVDIAWGTAVSAVTAAAGKWGWERMA